MATVGWLCQARIGREMPHSGAQWEPGERLSKTDIVCLLNEPVRRCSRQPPPQGPTCRPAPAGCLLPPGLVNQPQLLRPPPLYSLRPTPASPPGRQQTAGRRRQRPLTQPSSCPDRGNFQCLEAAGGQRSLPPPPPGSHRSPSDSKSRSGFHTDMQVP